MSYYDYDDSEPEWFDPGTPPTPIPPYDPFDFDPPYPSEGESDENGWVQGWGYRVRMRSGDRNEDESDENDGEENDSEENENDREESVNGSEENENDSESEDESSSDTSDSSGEEEMDIQDNPDPPAVTEECLLCKQQKSIIRFLPCGDSGICEDCSKDWSHCCKCNTKIQSRVPKIYPGNMPGNGIECVVCTEPIQARIGFVPCGHTNCCMKCAQTIGNTDKKCPVCRESITKLMPLYE